MHKLSKDFFRPPNEKIVSCTEVIGLIECFCVTFVRNLSAKQKKDSMVNGCGDNSTNREEQRNLK